jgi:hypothetical protein
MSLGPVILSASAVIFAEEIVRRMTVGTLARSTRKTSTGGVLVTNRTTTPYNKESKETLAKAIPIVSRTSGVLVQVCRITNLMAAGVRHCYSALARKYRRLSDRHIYLCFGSYWHSWHLYSTY